MLNVGVEVGKSNESLGYTSNVVTPVSNSSDMLNGKPIVVGTELVINKVPSSFANKLRATSLTKANLRKLEANVHNDADYDVLLPLASFNEVNDRTKNPLYGYLIDKRLAFPVVECGNLVMVVPNLEGTGYTKETILIEYEWELPRCNTCMIFGHSLDDCSKVAPKRVENQMDKGKGQIPKDDDEGFIEVKCRKSSGNNRGQQTLHIGFGEAKNSVSARLVCSNGT
ncbi:hypothetical protein Tco_1373214 [Tanacetum coccineum]